MTEENNSLIYWPDLAERTSQRSFDFILVILSSIWFKYELTESKNLLRISSGTEK